MNERKQMYFDYIGETASTNTQQYFKKAEDFENYLGKDLSEWTAKEIIDFYKSLCTAAFEVIANLNSAYRKYTNWCQSENMLADNINHYDEISYDTLFSCVNQERMNKRIISRKDLLNELSKIENPRDQFICLAFFEGFGGLKAEEIINVKLEDFKEGKVTFSRDRVVPYSKELYKFAKEASASYEYSITYTKDGNTYVRKFPMAGDKVVKKIISRNNVDDEVEVKSINITILNIQKATGCPAFVGKALKESGRIEMIKDIMAKNKDIKVIDAIKSTFPIYGKLTSIPVYLNKYADFLK